MGGGVVYSLLFQTVSALHPFRAQAASGQTAVLGILLLTGWWGLHQFMAANPKVYTDYLLPEEYLVGNVHGFLLLAATVAVFGTVLISLGNM